VTISLDRCERCTALFADHGGEVWRTWRDRVCRGCAATAEKRGETVMRVECAVCLDLPLPPTDGPDGRLLERVCGACTPLPPSVAADLDTT
jgi:hypothetical protein